MIRAGIIGAAGYAAGELMRILLGRQDVEVVMAQSESHAGKPVWTAHEDLYGQTSLEFSELAWLAGVDVLFLCSGHGKSKPFVESLGGSFGGVIIDLGNDFRLASDAADFVYGLPEAYREEIKSARHIANPGCFATAIQLALLPMAGRLSADVNVTGITGSTGAGQKLAETSHFSWRSGNVSVYKPFTHQHLGEIMQTLRDRGFAGDIAFVPVRGDFPRGIFISAYFNCELPEEEVVETYEKFYGNEPFVDIVPFNPDMKMVLGTNRCILHVAKYGGRVHVISMLDNLVKGAAGQAVENMNLAFGLPETEGLMLKSMRF